MINKQTTIMTTHNSRFEPLTNVLGTPNFKDDDEDEYIDGVDERPKPKPKPYNDDDYDY